MTGVEVILAALAAGAAAGTTDVAKAAVVDAYTALREALRTRLGWHGRVRGVLDVHEAEPGMWQAELGSQLDESGAGQDEEILAAARWLLELTDPTGTAAGKYTVDLRGASGVQVGDATVKVDTNYGAAGNFHAPVSFGSMVPPASPGAK